LTIQVEKRGGERSFCVGEKILSIPGDPAGDPGPAAELFPFFPKIVTEL